MKKNENTNGRLPKVRPRWGIVERVAGEVHAELHGYELKNPTFRTVEMCAEWIDEHDRDGTADVAAKFIVEDIQRDGWPND